MQDLNDMLYFAEVAERGGFAAAARALNLPKSRLSRRVADLEGRLGMRLLQRSTRRVSLTEAGSLYLRHCLTVREAAAEAEAAVLRVQAEPRGTIRVVCPVTLAQCALGPVLPQFLQRHPQVRVDMQVANHVVDLVEEGVDVALRVRASVDDSGSLVVKQLGVTQALLVASPALLAQQGAPQTVADLARFDTVAMSAGDGGTTWNLHGPGGARHALRHQPRYVADDLLTLRFAVLAGVGAAVLPDYLCRQALREGRLQQLLPAWTVPPHIVHAVFTSRRGMAPAVRSFLDFLGEQQWNDAPDPGPGM